MKNKILLTMLPYWIVCLSCLCMFSSTNDTISFRRQVISEEKFESAGAFDVNNDGHPDIISGAYWYEGPGFSVKHFIYQPRAEQDYYDDFSTLPMDVNGDGYLDIITGGWFGGKIYWIENPKNKNSWTVHEIAACGNVESTRLWDVDGDGYPEIVPNTPNKELAYYRLNRNAAGKPLATFTKIKVADDQWHGLGFGDVNGDGRKDFIISGGWLEAPVDPLTGNWKLHKEFDLGMASMPIIVQDVNGDGKNDLIVGAGHDYGLFWYEQYDSSGRRSWIKHIIDSTASQYHEMKWEDITGDGKPELITGKRYRAHQEKDPGSLDPVGLYYFTWNGKSFDKNIISYGPNGVGKGTGICLAIADLRGNGRKDIVVAGKDGLSVFYNEGRQPHQQ